MESNTTTETELPPPSPAPTTDTHSSPNTTTEPPNATTRTHNIPNLSEATTDTQQTPNTAETEANNLNRSSGPDSGDSGVPQESSPHSTAPVVSRQRNVCYLKCDFILYIFYPQFFLYVLTCHYSRLFCRPLPNNII